MTQKLLTRDEFREGVFARDGHRCIVCKLAGVLDAHHIIERRLWPDGGYYLDNGASVCEKHHIEAEQTTLSCDKIRELAGIRRVILPPHLYPDVTYDKWGNEILPNGTRLRGELFNDESVQKILAPVLGLFERRVKYPRTYHVPWSPGGTDDDRYHDEQWVAKMLGLLVVITEKMDGENTTMYSDYIHARSVDYKPHPSRSKVKALHGQIAHELPIDWRFCGENLAAVHSVRYEKLPSVFELFSVWDHFNNALSWDDTVLWAGMLGLKTVPVLYRGPFDTKVIREATAHVERDPEHHEGYVIRPDGPFAFRDFRRLVGKYVRKGHVQTHGHWMRQRLEWNGVEEN